MTIDVLIVEDDHQKSRAIRDCLLEVIPDIDPIQTDTIAIAGQLIETKHWDGIILDLAFHRTQKNADLVDRPYLAGVGILQQMKEMRKHCPVIIATQHESFINTKYGNFKTVDDLIEVIELSFPENYRGIVKVDLSSSLWRNQLRELIRKNFL